MNISLVGMMGCGKTTIAKILASVLDFIFVDTDEIIVNSEKMSINEIFENKGEQYFRNLEVKILKDILKNDNQIISTGGGIILREENIKSLKSNSIVFYLRADEETLFERIKNDSSRPLLNSGDMKQKISMLLNDRKDKYEKAHYIIDTKDISPNVVAEEIVRKIGINANA